MPARLYRTPLASHETLEDRQGGRAGEGGRWHARASPLSGILLLEQVSPLQEERHHRLPHGEQEGDRTVREIHGWSRRLGGLVVCLTVVLLGAGDAAAAAPTKFTVMNVVLDGTKIWLPSSLIVHQGDEVELTRINKLEDPHGFNTNGVRYCIFFVVPYSKWSRDLAIGGEKSAADYIDSHRPSGTRAHVQDDYRPPPS